MENIFITGVAGYIGSVVSELLVQKNYNVIGIDNLQEGNRNAVMPEVTFYEGNYGDKILLNEIFKKHQIEIVFHFAAETTIEFSMTDPYIYFENNVVNGLHLLDTMKSFDCKKIIFSSTAATYGEPKYVPIDEKHPQIPINAYGESKLIMERILDWYVNAYQFKYNLFRYFNASGATEKNGEDRKHESHLLPIALKTLNGQLPVLNLYGNDYPTKDGTCIRDYVHVLDIAQAHILAKDNLEKNPRGKFNLGSGNGFSVLEIVNTIEKVTNKKINWQFKERRLGDPAVLVASNELAKKELNWKPINSTIENIIETTYKWNIEHPNGYEKN